MKISWFGFIASIAIVIIATKYDVPHTIGILFLLVLLLQGIWVFTGYDRYMKGMDFKYRDELNKISVKYGRLKEIK